MQWMQMNLTFLKIYDIIIIENEIRHIQQFYITVLETFNFCLIVIECLAFKKRRIQQLKI
jgi:hypothetical protein